MIKKLFMLLALGQFYSSNSQVIEDFENGPNVIPNSIFRNQNSQGFNILDCNINQNFGSIITPVPGLNLLNQKVTIVSQGNFEPILLNYNINIDVVSANGNSYALRLNDITPINANANKDITSYTKSFYAQSNFLSFEYMAVLDSPHINDLNVQPFFTARLLNSNNQIIPNTQFCLIASPNDPLLVNQNSHLFFTKGYYCGMIKIPDEYINQNLKVQFIVADCGLGGDQGVVYIDNIINDVACDSPTYGYISLDYEQYPCPDDSFEVCGTYSMPWGTQLDSIFLEIKQNGNVVNTLDANSLIFFENGTFCFKVTPNDFGNLSGDFEFNVIGNFMAGNGFVYTLSYESTFDGPDVTCGNCVEPIDFTTWQDNDNIYWTELCEGGPYKIELISDGACCPEDFAQNNTYSITVNGNSVNKWDLLIGIQDKCFRWRIVLPDGTSTDWCCLTSYPYGNDVNDYYNIGCETYLNPPPSFGNLVLYPNPTSGKFTIENSTSSTFDFYDYSGNKVEEIKNNKKTKNFDISNLKSGVYIISTEKGEEFKIIKE